MTISVYFNHFLCQFFESQLKRLVKLASSTVMKMQNNFMAGVSAEFMLLFQLNFSFRTHIYWVFVHFQRREENSATESAPGKTASVAAP